jgi:hypothetical protein
MPKSTIIYPQETFEKQTNGVCFYKEGQLEDFAAAGRGVFESWRYNFDAGKQVFRAEKTGKVYEKRIVKDVHGNPHWTGWMEIPDAEVNGVQAIAINDRPLQLPNSDGAIKLQITPATINAYTKEETLSLVDEKVLTASNKAYIYVKWVIDPDTSKWATDPKRVLQITFPDGGISAQYYLVEPYPGTSGINEEATYWVWDEVAAQNPGGAQGYFDWLSVNMPNLRAFVSYPVFTEHTNDSHFHLKGQFERENWDAASGIIDGVSGEIHTHVADQGEDLSPHITAEERAAWNEAANNISEFPKDEKRYIASQGDFKLAYEQIQTSDPVTISLKSSETASGPHGTILYDGLHSLFQNLLDTHNIITHVQLDVGSVMTNMTSAWLETDTGLQSPIFTTGDPPIWRINFTKPFEKITILVADQKKSVNLKNVNLTVTYRPKQYVNIGDINPNVNDRLPLNLVGPEGDVLYNGKSLFEALSGGVFARSATWGNINGDIMNQNDLNVKLAQLLGGKVNSANMDSHLRWEVYRDGLIAGLIQQPDNKFEDMALFDPKDMGKDSTGKGVGLAKDTEIFTGIQNKLQDLKAANWVPYAARLYIDYIACYEDDNHDPLPVWFETDNNEILPSPSTGAGAFQWNWPGDTFDTYNSIYLRGNAVEYLDRVRLVVSCIQYGDAVAEAKGYQFTINGTNLFLNASGNITQTADSGLLNTYVSGAIENILHNKKVTIGEDETTTIEGSKFEYVSGNVTQEVAGNATTAISGTVVTDIEGDQTTTVSGTVTTTVSGDFELQAEAIQLTPAEVFSADTKRLDFTASESGTIATRNFSLLADETVLGVTDQAYPETYPDPYPDDQSVIKVYGEEIDHRYAGRELFEAHVDRFDTFSGDIADEIVRIDQAIDTEAHDRISGDAEEANARVSGFFYFSGTIEERATEIYDTVSGEVSGYVHEIYTHIEDNYYTKDDIDDTRYTKDETYTQEEVNELVKVIHGGEQWDIIIHDNEELTALIDSDGLANNDRILIKKGNYNYAGDKPINLTGVKFLKGEEPVSIIANLSSIIHDEETLYETIRFEAGAVGFEYVIDSTGNRIKKYEIAGDGFQVALDKFHKIYHLVLTDNAKVQFINVVTGKDYTFWVDQKTDLKQFNITNYLHNAKDLTHFELENQAPRMRTVIHATGNNITEHNGLVINAVIPKTEGEYKIGALMVYLGNTKGTLHNSSKEVEFVNPHHEFPFPVQVGETFQVMSSFIHSEAWTHTENGHDWELIDPDNNNHVIAFGKISNNPNDTESQFTILESELPNSADLILKFNANPNLINVILDGTFDINFIETSTLKQPIEARSFGQYQGYYEQLTIDIRCKDNYTSPNATDPSGWYIYKTEDNIGHSFDAQLPWTFFIDNNDKHLTELIITPYYYEILYNIPRIDVASNPNTVFFSTVSNGGKIYDRNAIGGDKTGPSYLNGRLLEEFEFFDDGTGKAETSKYNTLEYTRVPPLSNGQYVNIDDPISIIDYKTDEIEVVGNNKIKVLKSDIDSFAFNTLTAAGLLLPWSGKVVRPIKELYISGLENRYNNEIMADGADNDEVVHKGYSEDNYYKYDINWSGYIPTHVSGTWTVQSLIGGQAAWEKTGVTDDYNTFIAKKQGSVKVTFTPEYNPDKAVSKTIMIKVHQDDMIPRITREKLWGTEANPYEVKTTTEHMLYIDWLDKDGNKIENPETELDDTRFTWTLDDPADAEHVEIVDPNTGEIKILNANVPYEGKKVKLNVEANTFRVNYDDTPDKVITAPRITSTFYMNIRRNSYMLDFQAWTGESDGYTGIHHNVPKSGLHEAWAVIDAIIALDNGYKLADDYEDYLKEELKLQYVEGYKMVETSDGVGRLHFYMPYCDIEIKIKTTTI